MKKVLSLLIAVLIIMLCFCSCAEVIKKEPIDYAYTEPYTSIETDYKYKYNIMTDEYDLVPYVHTVTHSARYKVKYHIKYDDGSEKNVWETVDEDTYNNAKNSLPP